ncbi:exodeoxyribonuclease VII, large subunit [Aedoeadaptatus nemausensis]|uniref:Exodeoxyribonuclease 7 large subunit n=1 Tax=Aedoeadaptatus nemausensis TaxID=2582829 RepID=A0A6V6XZV7_9FIRM|nr:exodeoxyribonuclease VII large subunit [Peptoniphilus nemausensis]CAC9925110.1 exodeoxyribonuclease VII, large subunit [Peptoniphilus nemausensis]
MIKPISISELLDYTKKIVKTDYILRKVRVRGEVAEIATAQSGHLYFTLKDDRSRLACVMFRDDLSERAAYQVGMEVEIDGYVDIYAPSGRLQLIAKTLEPTGQGALYKLFLELKDLLEKEGLFDMEKKRPLPKNPLTIGMVTSTAGAAQHDFLSVAAARNPAISVIISPSRVQGEEAGKELARAFEKLDARDDIDVIIITRGGGSMEDLFCFNDETLIRAIDKRRHPVVSAVGHEVDTTLSDFVADVRAATPTHGAEIIVPHRMDILDEAESQILFMENTLLHRLRDCSHAQKSLYYRLKHTISMESVAYKLDMVKELKRRMVRQMVKTMDEERRERESLLKRIKKIPLEKRIYQEKEKNDAIHHRLNKALMKGLQGEKERLELLNLRIKSVGESKRSPRIEKNGRGITSVRDLKVGDELSIAFIDGTVDVSVKGVTRYKDEL